MSNAHFTHRTAATLPGQFSFAVNTSILFTELIPGQRPAAAAAAGFRAVESWWPFDGPVPTSRDVDAFVASVLEAGVKLIGLNFFAGDLPAGERGVASVPGRGRELVESLPVLAHVAERTGCRLFNLLYGQRASWSTPAEQDELALEHIVLAADTVAPFGGTVLIEPLTKGENGAYPLLTSADVMAVVSRARAVGRHNVAMLLDAYHLANNGERPELVTRRHFASVGHVQVADAPGRHEPGTGEIVFDALWTALDQLGYQGFVSLEYRPTETSVASLNWLPLAQRGR